MVDTRFRALNADTLKKEYGSDGVFFNGPGVFVANGFTGISYNNCGLEVIGWIAVLLGIQSPKFPKEFVSGPPVAYNGVGLRAYNTFSFNVGDKCE